VYTNVSEANVTVVGVGVAMSLTGLEGLMLESCAFRACMPVSRLMKSHLRIVALTRRKQTRSNGLWQTSIKQIGNWQECIQIGYCCLILAMSLM
jgi:hypothetical protein